MKVMKRRIALALAACSLALWAEATDFTDVSITVNGRNVTMNNGKIIVSIGSDGRVSSLKYNQSKELLGANGIYFDYTTAEGNKGLSPTEVKVIKNTPEICEVLYYGGSGNTLFEQGYIMRKDVAGIYTYVVATGTSTSAKEPIKEARVCTRMAGTLLEGYVDWRMNGTIPSNIEMGVAEQEKNTVQDATYYLEDGSIYTKYDWANYIDRDTLHGLSDKYYGVWNIPVSYEWINGGPERQELTVHATSKSPISIQMLQGEHLGGAAMVLGNGEKKLYGPFLIYSNMKAPKITGPIEDAKAMAALQQEEWPFQWFDHDLYPKARGTINGHLDVTTGQRNDSVRIILAQEKGKDPITHTSGYQFWTLTDEEGNFELKHVRPGTYHLYAYATCGDVTDMLEVNDIEVVEGEQTLAPIEWTPNCYTDRLWLIGKNDRRSSEYNLSNSLRQYGLWEAVPANLTYVIGKSQPEKDWYYAQTKGGTWTIGFTLDKKYSGTAYLTASLAGTTHSGSTVTVKVNGTTCGTWKPDFNDAAIYRSAIQSGRHQLMRTAFNASFLKQGYNTVTLTMAGNGKNGGFMYDCLKLEAGERIVSSMEEIVGEYPLNESPKPIKTIKNGRFLIIVGDAVYNSLGVKEE